MCARPEAGPPPVQSAIARREPGGSVQQYEQLIHAFDREDRKAELLAWLGNEDAVQRFLAVALHALSTNSDLLEKATLPSIIQAVKDSAALGLEPTGLTGEAYILRFGDKATLIPGWKGYIKRIRNSGVVQDVDCQIVYMKDDFEVKFGTDPYIRHVPKLVGEKDSEGNALAERGEYRGVYAVAWMPSGRPIIEWMTMQDIYHDARAFSPSVKSGRSSPWDSHPGEMSRKTVIRRLSKRLPQSAVDRLLLEVEARADAAEAGASGLGENGNGKTLDVARARSAVLAAAAGRRAGTVPPRPVQSGAPAAAPTSEPEHPASPAQEEPEAQPDAEEPDDRFEDL